MFENNPKPTVTDSVNESKPKIKMHLLTESCIIISLLLQV